MPVVPRSVEVESVSDRSESPRPLPAKVMSNRMILALAKSGWLPLARAKTPEPKKSPPAPVPRNAGESGTPGRRGLQRAGWIPKDKPEPKPSVESWRRPVDESRDKEKELALFRRMREQRLAKEAAAKKNPPTTSKSAPAPAPPAPVSTPAPISAPIPVSAPVEWSFAEDYTVDRMRKDGKTWEEMSDKLGRPVRAVRQRYFELRMRDMKTPPTLETLRARDAEIKAAREQATTPTTLRPTSSSSRPSTATSSGSALSSGSGLSGSDLSSPTAAASSRTSLDTPTPARPGFIKAQRRTKPKTAPTRAAAPPPPPPPHRYLPTPTTQAQKSSLRPQEPPTPPTTPPPSRRVKFSVLSKASPEILASLTRAINTKRGTSSSSLSGLNPRPDETEACKQFYRVHGHAPPPYRGLFKVDGEGWTQLACWVLETLQARWCEGGGALVGPMRAFSGQVFTGEEVRGKIGEVGLLVGL